jgi:site-specific recombinase XerD
VRGLRDTALIAIALCTGARRTELANLEVRDLRQRLGGELALHIREGKGRKERLVLMAILPGVCAWWMRGLRLPASPKDRFSGGSPSTTW